MEVLTRCRHNGFPVVGSCLGDDEDSGEFDAAGQGASRAGSLQGLILRSQILVMLRHQVRLLATALSVSSLGTTSRKKFHQAVWLCSIWPRSAQPDSGHAEPPGAPAASCSPAAGPLRICQLSG